MVIRRAPYTPWAFGTKLSCLLPIPLHRPLVSGATPARSPHRPTSLVYRMAQSSRSSSSSASLSDDPMEKLGDWLQVNSRPIGMAVGGIAVVALAVFGYRSYSAGQSTKASTALYAAQAPLSQGKFDDATKALEKVATGYAGTASGQQAALLLAQAASPEQSTAIGNQSGGRVMFFLYTDDFDRDYAHMAKHNVVFTEAPRLEDFGKVVVFADKYGNKWDFIERRSS